MRREELADLSGFVAVAEEGSFTRAAAKLGTSQSALSYTIRRLETRLGLRLLTRTTRKVVPTDAGERLLRTVRPALDDIGTELSLLRQAGAKPAGTIRITTGEHAATTLLWPKLSPLLIDYPDIKLELNIDHGLTDIVAERYDAGVRLGEQIAKDMISVCIGPPIRMAAVASPDYMRNRATPIVPGDLAHHACINLRLPTLGGVYVWEFEKAGRALKVRVDGPVVLNNLPMILTAARDGFGIAFVMQDMAAADMASGRLIRVLDDWCDPFPGYHLYYPSRRQASPAFSLVADALRYRS